MRTLEDCRKELDALDDELIKTYLARLALSREIGDIKAANGLAVYDRAREDDIISRRTAGLNEEEAAAVAALYRTVFETSRQLQRKRDAHE